jgi:carbon starvation protein
MFPLALWFSSDITGCPSPAQAPIIASIVGLLWGWGPALLWMVFGVLLIGGVHDYFALMISVRREGKSMRDVISERLGKLSEVFASIVLAFGDILVYAIFLSVIATTQEQNPTAAIPTLALIPIAILCGVLFKKGMPVATATIIGLALTLIFIVLGIKYPLQMVSLHFFGKEIILFSESFWIYLFVIYTFFAVYTPVWLLLQSRDYLNSAVLLIGLLLGIVGLLLGRPQIQMPFFHGFTTSLLGPLWPMLFATIFCGTASGWHSLIAAGTTSKQLSKESHGFRIAYGGMIGEMVMAVLSACLIITGFTYKEFLATGLKSSSIGVLFSQALGQAMSHLGIPLIIGSTLGALALAALTLTTLDSFARTSRYVIQELGQKSLLCKPLVSSLFVTVAGLYSIYENLIPDIEKKLPKLTDELLQNVEVMSPEIYRKYFLDPNNDDFVPEKSGYYMGYLIVKNLEKEYSLAEMVKWDLDTINQHMIAGLKKLNEGDR